MTCRHAIAPAAGLAAAGVSLCIAWHHKNTPHDLQLATAAPRSQLPHTSVAPPQGFLQQMVSLFVASHYKNTPNDLLLMADAPAHQLFVLLAPVDETVNALPSILAAVQACLLHFVNYALCSCQLSDLHRLVICKLLAAEQPH
jgi:tRNA(Met) C34 N-acetyltransferase TmcA